MAWYAVAGRLPFLPMPSMIHESLLLLFRNRPTLAPEVLRDALGVLLPAFTEARIESGDLTEVVLYYQGVPVMSIVVEAQLPSDEDNALAWPGNVVGSFTRYRCQACLLVVTIHRAVAARSAEPIVIGPNLSLTPFVIGPSSAPVIAKAEMARAMPELAVLSAMAHGRSKAGLKVALAALAGAAGLEEERAMLYEDMVLSSLNKMARRALEAMMTSGNYETQSDFLKKYIAKGEAKGKVEGKAEGIAKGVLTVFEARGLAIPDDVRQQVAASRDLAELERWLRRAVVVGAAGEIFDKPR